MMGHAAILLPNDAGHAAPQWPKIVDGVPNIDIVGTSFYGSTTNVTYDSVEDPDCCEWHFLSPALL